MTKVQKVAKHLNEVYPERFALAFGARFDVAVSSSFNIFAMSLVSRRNDGKDFTAEQKAWSEAFSAGFADAMEQVHGTS